MPSLTSGSAVTASPASASPMVRAMLSPPGQTLQQRNPNRRSRAQGEAQPLQLSLAARLPAEHRLGVTAKCMRT